MPRKATCGWEEGSPPAPRAGSPCRAGRGGSLEWTGARERPAPDLPISSLEMTTPSTEFTADAAAALPGPAWMQQRRADALARFEARALPTEAEEVWRYSRIDELDLSAYRPVVAREAPTGLPAAVPAVADPPGPRPRPPALRDRRRSPRGPRRALP